MDWSGEWWVLILGPGLVILVVGILYFTRSRAFRFRSAAAQLGFIALQGLNPISDEEKKGVRLFSESSGGKITNLFGDRIDAPSRLVFDFTTNTPSPGAQSAQTVAAFRCSFEDVADFKMIPIDAVDEWLIEKAGRWIIFYRHSVLISPDEIPGWWQRVQSIANPFLKAQKDQ
jgi:hypothetical protein